MKKIILFWVFSYLIVHADTIAIDRTGYHTALGGTAFLIKEISIPIPTFNVAFEYGLTEQSTFVLEHQGYLLAGLMTLEYKYYMHSSEDTWYLFGGATSVFAVDYGVELNTGVVKAGMGYAWNHVESDISAIGNSDDIILGISLRYKF